MHNASTTRYRNKLRTENPEHLLYQTARTSALNRNLDFDLSVEDITIPKTCPILGIPIDVFAKKQFNSPSVDRVDNSKGYVKGNVKIISNKANLMKRDNTEESLLAILRYIKENKSV
jgi:hypothetical protein